MKHDLSLQLRNLKSRQEMVNRTWNTSGNKELLQFFMEILPKVVDADRCSFFINDPVANQVWLQCGTGLEERSIIVPKTGSNVGRVIASGKFISIVKKDQMSPFAKKVEEQVGYQTYNMLCVPIKSLTTGQVTGALQVINKKGKNKQMGFTDEDRKILEKVANHLEMVTENIYLGQEMVNVSDKLRGKVDMAEWVIKMWMGFMGLVVAAAFAVIFYFTPHIFGILQR